MRIQDDERGLRFAGVFFLPSHNSASFPNARAPRRSVPPQKMWSPSCASSFQPPSYSSWHFCCSSYIASARPHGPRARFSASTSQSTHQQKRRLTSCQAYPGVVSRTFPTRLCLGRRPPSRCVYRPPTKRPPGIFLRTRPQVGAFSMKRVHLDWMSQYNLLLETI